MKKLKDYNDVRFSADVMREALSLFRTFVPQSELAKQRQSLMVSADEATWTHDTEAEFFSDYRRSHGQFQFVESYPHREFHALDASGDCTRIEIKGLLRSEIEAVFDIFNRNEEAARRPLPKRRPVVFIGHGQSAAWKELKDQLQDKHHFKVIAYETGVRAGHAIRDILDEMLRKSTFALLVLTAEDDMANGDQRARQNVIHETGLFQGKLGFTRAIVLLEEGVEDFSNIRGIEQIRFAKNNIKECFGDVVATLRREFD